ncbi:MAG: molybdopterin synthase sulfur carrier subunit [Acidobacteria bacterium]|nr:MAG: molybdopterin synthase sulfur carrier subunit [Acidobacteriota bacterium]REK09170.1 MAG: molybdopterin synthase sulfur carrier subunit [Acidobacteriota bacterium]
MPERGDRPDDEGDAVERVEVHLPSLLRPAVGGRSSVTVERGTLGQCLERLVRDHPLLAPHLFDDRGELREHVNLFVGERNVRWRDRWHEAVPTGEGITVLQAVSGG